MENTWGRVAATAALAATERHLLGNWTKFICAADHFASLISVFVERRINPTTGAIELWWCEWEKSDIAGAKKIYVKKIADEAVAVDVQLDSHSEESAICWAYGRTLGDLTPFSVQFSVGNPHAVLQDTVVFNPRSLRCDVMRAIDEPTEEKLTSIGQPP